jgi:hypothetical protein
MSDARVEAYIRKLIDHEEAMREMYQLFADFLPDHGDFWMGIAREEIGHAQVLRKLHTEMLTAGVEFDPGGLQSEGLQESLEFVIRSRNDCMNDGIDMEGALNIAVFMERVIVDHRFFKCFKGLTPEVESQILAIHNQTVDHLKRIEEFTP